MNNQTATANTGFVKSVIYIILTGFIIWFTGFILILATRLFYRFWRYPTFGEAFWTGFAFWWVFAMYYLPISPNDTPKEHIAKAYNGMNPGYEYDIINNKLIFVVPPDSLPKVIQKSHDIFTDKAPLFVHGLIDGKNKEFYISSEKNRIIAPDLGEDHGFNISALIDEKVITKKAYQNSSERFNSNLWSWLIIGLGIMCFTTSQLKAITAKNTT